MEEKEALELQHTLNIIAKSQIKDLEEHQIKIFNLPELKNRKAYRAGYYDAMNDCIDYINKAMINSYDKKKKDDENENNGK